MKVFISWSGELSRDVATILRDWLPSVIQSIDPYVSSEDIDKGTRWSSDISGELEASNFGILCITPNNVHAPWINFEAGALSKSVDSSRVSPFLFNVKRSDVTGPLVQFQSTINEREDIFKLVSSINEATDRKIAIDRLKNIFDVWWPQLQDSLGGLSDKSDNELKRGSGELKKEPQILEEVLELVRSQSILLRDPEKLFPRAYVENIFNLSETNKIIRSRQLERPVQHIRSTIQRFKQRVVNGDVSEFEIAEFLTDLEGPVRYITRNLQLEGFE